MFSLINQVFIVFLKLSRSLASLAKVSDQAKFLSLKDEPSMVRPTLIDWNPIELKYYRFMISLDICNECCTVIPPKLCVLKKQKT